MSDAVAKVKELTEKRDKATVALTRLQTQLEAAETRHTEAVAALKDEFDTTPEAGVELLATLAAARDASIAKAEETLGRVKL